MVTVCPRMAKAATPWCSNRTKLLSGRPRAAAAMYSDAMMLVSTTNTASCGHQLLARCGRCGWSRDILALFIDQIDCTLTARHVSIST